jgi:endonuclease YncB( thermonuclease family)
MGTSSSSCYSCCFSCFSCFSSPITSTEHPLEKLETPQLIEHPSAAPEEKKIVHPDVRVINATWQNTKEYLPKPTHGKVIKVYDGDTIWIAQLYEGEVYRFNIRMYGYDSPELRSKNAEEKLKALAAKEALSKLILNKMVRIETIQKKEKFGRILAFIYLDGPTGVPDPTVTYPLNVNEWMKKNGHGKEYFGGTKEEW